MNKEQKAEHMAGMLHKWNKIFLNEDIISMIAFNLHKIAINEKYRLKVEPDAVQDKWVVS